MIACLILDSRQNEEKVREWNNNMIACLILGSRQNKENSDPAEEQ